MGLGDKKRPTPPPPTNIVAADRIMGISLWCKAGYERPASATIRLDDPAGTECTGIAQSATRFLFSLPGDKAQPGHGATLTVHVLDTRRNALRLFVTRITLMPSADIDIAPPALDAPFPLHADGQWFKTDDGTHVFVAAISGFTLHQLFDNGVTAADDFMGHVKELGYDEIRVFTRFRGGLGQFDGNLDTLPVLCEHAGAFGLRLELVASADHVAFGWTDDQEVRWHQNVCAIAAAFSHIAVEGVNEGTHPANVFDYTRLQQPTGVLAARGSGQSDGGTLLPLFTGPLAYASYHPGRSNDFPRKVGHNAWEDVAARFNIATKSNEIARPDETGASPTDYFDAGANAALFITAATMHDTEGKAAVIASGPTLDCRREFVRGCRAIDLQLARNGSYTRPGLSDCPIDVPKLPDSSRAHVKVWGNRAQAVITQMPIDCTPRPVNGWHIVGLNGAVVTLER